MKKLKVGMRVQWTAYGKKYKGTVERIEKDTGMNMPVKVRPDPQFKGDKPYLTRFKAKNVFPV